MSGFGELPFCDYGSGEGSEFGELAGLEVQVFEEEVEVLAVVFGEEFLEVFLVGVGFGGAFVYGMGVFYVVYVFYVGDGGGFPGIGGIPGIVGDGGVPAGTASFFAVGVAGGVGVYVWFYECEYTACEGFQRVGLSSVQCILHYGCQDFEPDVPRQVAYCFVEAAVEYE